jgi:hypothetical protein
MKKGREKEKEKEKEAYLKVKTTTKIYGSKNLRELKNSQSTII